jgi:glycosyltransferase involved in cell wall biosynthesis
MGSEALLWVIPAYVFAGFFVLWHWSSILLAAIYHHALYPRWRKRHYDPEYLPRCSLIVPCKGTLPHFQDNLLAFLRQDYPRYEVIFCVEGESDDAVPIIKSAIAQSARASLVVAGLTSACAQKVHNQLAALQHVDSPEVLVFADSDIAPAPGWLRQLVLPLSVSTVSIATGYYWLSQQAGTGSTSTLGELAHCYMNRVAYALFASTMYWGGAGLWGGTMAMRKADFEALRVASRWQECVVDDVSLSEIAVRRKLKIVLVPQCITPTDNTVRTFASFTAWCARQVMNLKAYGRGQWAFGVFLSYGYIAVSALFPVSVLGTLFTQASFWEWGGGASLILFVGEMLATLFYALLGPTPKPVLFTFLAPVLRLAQGVGCLKTIGTSTMHWSGVHYTVDRSGRVVCIKR